MNRRQKLKQLRGRSFIKSVKKPYWWPTRAELNDRAYDSAVADLTEAEDKVIIAKLTRG